MTRRVIFIDIGGGVTDLCKVPSSADLERIIGGHPEMVRVLDRIEAGRFIYTAMFVHETGLKDGMPRNQTATEIYQRNVRAAYPDAPNPFQAATEAWKSRMPVDAVHIDGTPEIAKAAGYADDPWIAGGVVFFEGWTIEEVDEALAPTSKKKKP